MALAVLGVATFGALPAPLTAVRAIDRLAELDGVTTEDPTVTMGTVTATSEASASSQVAEFTTDAPDDRARVAVTTALAQIGLPYVWGGDGPMNGEAGFDCSGLTTYAYGVAGVELPRTAHTQYYAGPHVPEGAPLQPGDLVFYGTSTKVHHVGMYVGGSRMVNAPTFGKPVQVAYYRWNGDDYLGATRPAATGHTGTGLLPTAPAPVTSGPTADPPAAFEAPVATLAADLPKAGRPQPAEAESAAAALAEQQAQGATTSSVPSPAAEPSSTAVETRSSSAEATTATGTPSSEPSSSQPSSAVVVSTTPSVSTPTKTSTAGVSPVVSSTTAPSSASNPQTVVTSTAPPLQPSTTAVALPAGTATLRPARSGPGGLPAAPGIQAMRGRTVIRVAPSLVADAVAGSPLKITLPDGTTATYTLTAVTSGIDTATAAATVGRAVVIAETTPGQWTVLVAD